MDIDYLDNYLYLKSIVNRIALNKNEGFHHLNRISLLISLSKAFGSILFKSRKVKSFDYFVFSKGINNDLRKRHVSENLIVDDLDRVKCFNPMQNIYVSMDFTTIFRQIKIFFYFFLSFLFYHKNSSRFNIHWWLIWYKQINQVIQLSNQKEIQFIYYNAYLIETFLTAKIGEKYTRLNALFVLSGTSMYTYNRYTFLPESDFVLCSSVQFEELNIFQKLNWVRFKNISKWSLEEVDDYKELTNRFPKYHIGIYSCGAWARRLDFLRENNIDKLRKNDYSILPGYVLFDKLIDSIIQIKYSKPHIRIVLFPHPYERKLYKTEGLTPPYLKKLNANGIELNLDGKNSIQQIYDSEIAVSISSTACTDRWNLNLKAFIFDGTDYNYRNFVFVKREYIGKYGKYCYRSMDELKKKINAELAKSVNNPS